MAEISVETNNYAADIGNVGGAVISNVIKSGTNKSAATPSSLPEQRFRRQHVGEQRLARAEAGAKTAHLRRHARRPDRQEQVFIFGDYQGSRQDAPGDDTASVAPEAWRRGDLSSVARAIRDP